MTPFYKDELITLYCDDCLTIPEVWTGADILITDPPYGMSYWSGKGFKKWPKITGDDSTRTRDEALELWHRPGLTPDDYEWGDPAWSEVESKPGLVFGRWNIPAPKGEVQRLIWHKATTAGMGELSIPWGTNYEVIHRIGESWNRALAKAGRRGAVISTHEVRGGMYGEENKWNHPTPKPVPLMEQLIECVPPGWVIADPFAGVGATLRAAKNMGRRAIGVEIDEGYCKTIVKRLQQETLFN